MNILKFRSQKYKTFFGALLVLPLLLCAPVKSVYWFPSSTNVEKLEIIRIVGIDKKNEDIRLSLAVVDNQKEGKENNYLIHGFGSTFFEAADDAGRTANSTLFWGHADILVLGEDAAKDNISKYIDFLVRDRKARLNMKVLVVKGGTADDLLSRKGNADQSIYDGLSEQIRSLRSLTYAPEVSLSDLLASAGDARPSYLLPAVALRDEENYEIDGVAAMCGGTVTEFLDRRSARACALVRGTFYRSIEVLDTRLLGRISIEADNAASHIVFREEQGKIVARIDVSLSGSFAEQFENPTYGKSRYTAETMSEISRDWSAGIRSSIEDIARKDEKTGGDLLGIQDNMYHFHPHLYEKQKAGMPLCVEVSVSANLNRIHVVDREI